MQCLWWQEVSAWLSDFHIHPFWLFCFCVMFAITESECLIFRFPHSFILTILLPFNVCDYRKWVLDSQIATSIHLTILLPCNVCAYRKWVHDCQISTSIHFDYSASMQCLWLQGVSAWLSGFPHSFILTILLPFNVCDYRMWVLDCQISTFIHFDYSASVPCLSPQQVSARWSDCHIQPFWLFCSVPCLWLQRVSAWFSDFHIHPFWLFCFCAMFVITASECMIVDFHIHPFWLFCFCAMFVITACECLIARFQYPSILTILLLCHVCDYRESVLDGQISISIHFDYSAFVPCLWLQYVSAWLSDFHIHPIWLFCVPCLWLQLVSAWLSDFHVHPFWLFCFCGMFVIPESECLIVRSPYPSILTILLLFHVCNYRESVAWLSGFHIHPFWLFCFCAMFVITVCKCLIVRFIHPSIVLILLLCHVCDHRKWVIGLSDFRIQPFWLFCFCAMFMITDCECLIVRFPYPFWLFCFHSMFVIIGCECLIVWLPHPTILTILLLCHVCDYSLWVFDCQISTSIHFDYSASVPCLWLQLVSAWLSDFHIYPFWQFCFHTMFVITVCKCLIVKLPHSSILTILLLCHVCDDREWVLDCQISTSIHFDYSASVPCLWLQGVSAQLSDFYIHPFWLFCFCVMFVITGSECLIVRFPYPSILTILLLCYICDYSLWVLDCQIPHPSILTILLLCHVCHHSKWVLDC